MSLILIVIGVFNIIDLLKSIWITSFLVPGLWYSVGSAFSFMFFIHSLSSFCVCFNCFTLIKESCVTIGFYGLIQCFRYGTTKLVFMIPMQALCCLPKKDLAYHYTPQIKACRTSFGVFFIKDGISACRKQGFEWVLFYWFILYGGCIFFSFRFISSHIKTPYESTYGSYLSQMMLS